jgi:aspartate 1-decarboxylase
MMTGKVHRATVTEANLHYIGSITLDPDLIEAADFLPYEQVHVVDITNGNRLQTYVIEGRRGSGEVCINGAAAHLVDEGDLVILIAYQAMDDAAARTIRPRQVFVDEQNRITDVVLGDGLSHNHDALAVAEGDANARAVGAPGVVTAGDAVAAVVAAAVAAG